MHRWPGAIIAGGLFVVPGIISILALSYIYAAYGNVPAVASLFFGLKAAVLAIVLQAVHRVGSRALKSPADDRARGAGVSRHLLSRRAVSVDRDRRRAHRLCRRPLRVNRVSGRRRARLRAAKAGPDDSLLGEQLPEHARPTVGRALRVSALWLALWLVPVIAMSRCSAAATSSPRSARSSPRWPLSPSAAPMRCSPIWRSRRSRPTAGCGPARCSTGSAWPRPPPGR